ncbi:MAG: TlpA family protein disulfide reductase [Flaviaesturariibacter sp.]|nr:TlpA family protein disulfide reductase [Flaviaesturariibacter sp.]
MVGVDYFNQEYPYMKKLFLLLSIAVSYSVTAQKHKDSVAIGFMQELAERINSIKGKELSEFDACTLDGVRYTSDSLRGKLTVLSFWFEACMPCVAEVAGLNQLYADFKGNNHFRFLSFTFDPVAKAKAFVAKNDICYPVIRLEEHQIRKLNFNAGFPVIALVNEAGIVVYFRAGGSNSPQIAKEDLLRDVYPNITKLVKIN